MKSYVWILLTLLLTSGCIHDRVVSPDDGEGVATIKTSCNQYAEELAGDYSRAADRLEANAGITEKEDHDARSADRKAALKRAFQSLADREQAALGSGQWTPAVAAKFYRDVAKEVRGK